MILTVTLNAAIDKRYVVKEFQVGEVNRVLSARTHLAARDSMCRNLHLSQVQK